MDATARLLDDIRAAPDDDAPRLVWADAVGGERGELVVVQCQLAAGKLAPREAIKLRKRQRDLIARHGPEWSGLSGIASRVSFSRGFVDAAKIDGLSLLEHADTIRRVAPLLTAVSFDDEVSTLFDHPLVRELHGFSTDGAIGDFVVEQLVATGTIDRLRALGIRDGLAATDGVRALLAKRALPNMERLALGDYLRGDAIAAVLGMELPALRAFEIERARNLGEIVAVLPPTVRELTISTGLGDIAELAAGGIPRNLERLVVPSYAFRDQTHVFGAFTRLRALTISGAADDDIVRGLAQQTLPALRELAILLPYARGETMMYVGTMLGSQLELLDMRGSFGALRHLNDIKPKVAGELLVGHPSDAEGLLRTTPTIQMPWWDHVNV